MRHEKFAIDDQAAGGDAGRHGSQRAELSLLCEVRQGLRPWKLARLLDLSTAGFRLAWLPEYDEAKPIRIRIPGIQMLSARVCWRKGRQIGCEFSAPLHIAVFEHIAHLAGGEIRR